MPSKCNILDVPPQRRNWAESALHLERLQVRVVDGQSAENELCVSLLGLLDGVFNLKPRGEQLEVFTQS
jgi:hypothetical protein